MLPPREKKHRLPEAAYYGRKSVSFTACIDDRSRILADWTVVGVFLPMLAQAAETNHCIVPIYCFMPDHMHVVLTGASEEARPKTAMEDFKHRSGIWFEENMPQIEWQKDFHDRIVRKSIDYAAHLRYIASNPIRAGLATDVYDWPFTGSLGCNLRDVLGDAFW